MKTQHSINDPRSYSRASVYAYLFERLSKAQANDKSHAEDEAASFFFNLGQRFGIGAFIVSGMLTGCASIPPKFASHNQHHGRAFHKQTTLRITGVRDVQARAEIYAELTDLKKLSDAIDELRAQFTRQPLKGPITVAHLENTLRAQFHASEMLREMQAQINLTLVKSSAPGTPREKLAVPTVLPRKKAPVKDGEKDDVPSVAAVELKEAASSSYILPGHTKITSAGKTVRSESAPSFEENSGIPALMLDPESLELEPSARLAEPNLAPAEKNANIATLKTLSALGEPGLGLTAVSDPPSAVLKKLNSLESSNLQFSGASETPLIFDIPVTYNARVSFWIHYFQTEGRTSFRSWLERSARYLPILQYELTRSGLPQDLVYVAMIESGFSPAASSHASAMGLWQFIEPTGRRYGLKMAWWLDERKDFLKSTRAAIGYMTDLYRQFNSWYLVAASYNMGENGVRRLIQRHRTNNFWELADKRALPNETTNYVPKIIAATLISKAPALYGFRDLDYQMPMSFEYFNAPGGTDLVNLAQYLGVSEKYLKDLNPELIRGFVPRTVGAHKIRIPKGSVLTVSKFVRLQAANDVIR